MWWEKIKNLKIILASNSPRRKEFLEALRLSFEVRPSGAEEHYAPHLKKEEIALHIAQLKANFFTEIAPDELIIACDTIVWNEEKALGKPHNYEEAFEMLKSISGKTHQVISAVCLRTKDKQKLFFESTEVTFRELQDEEINYYIKNYQPYDKAGAYGIQEWIGMVGILSIKGSYTNVVGLPTSSLIRELKNIIEE